MADIRVEIQLEDKSFTSGTMRAGQSLRSFREELARTNRHFADLQAAGQGGFRSLRRVEESGRGALSTLRDLSVVAHGASLAFNALSGASSGLLGNIIRVNSEMEKLRYQMAGMSSAADPMADANKQVKQLQKLATQTPFAIGALSSAFVKMKTAGLDPANGSLKALTDGLAAFGASDDQLNRVVLGITQMSGKGVIQMEELRQQLGESMPTAMKLMARSMGVSIADLTKAISTGRVEAGTALTKWFDEVERSYGGTGEMMMKTFSGQMSKIKTELVKLVDEGEIGVAFERLKEMLGEFSAALGTDEAKKFFDGVGLGFQTALAGIESFTKFLWSIREEFAWMAKVALVSFGAIAAGGAIKSLSRVLLGIRTDILSIGVASRTASAEVASRLGATALVNSLAGSSASIAQAMGLTGLATRAGGVVSSLGSMVAFGGKLLGVLGPVGLLVGTFGPALWEGVSALAAWATGAKKVEKSMEEVKRETVEANQAALEAQKVQLENEVRRYKNVPGTREEFDEQNANANQLQYGVRLGKWERLVLQKQSAEANLQRFMADYGDLVRQYNNEIATIEDEEREKRVQERLDAIERDASKERTDISKRYRNAQDAATEKLMQDQAAARARGESGRRENEEYQETLRANQIAQVRELLALNERAAASAQTEIQDTQERASVLQVLLDKRSALEKQLADLGDKEFKISFLMETENEDKKFARLERTFNSAQERVKSLGAELNGASGDVAKLFFQIKRGDFGRLDEGSELVDAMRDSLIEATVAAEALDKILKNTGAAENEITRIYEKLQEENLKALAALDGVNLEGPFADLEFFNWKKLNGHLEGIGKTPADTVRMAIESVTQGIDTSVTQFKSLGDTMKEEVFGNDTILKIQSVGQAIQDLRGIVTGLNGDFADFAIPGSLFAGGSPLIKSNVDGGILDLIARRESGGDYNATLDHGQWTGGPQNLVGMTLNQVRELQKQMLANPANRAKYGNGKGSSALGRYQIVGQTLQGLMEEMGLTGNELYDEAMQDKMAARLLGRRGRNAAGLRNEWEGLKGVSDADIYAAWDISMTGPTKTRANSAANTPAFIGPQQLAGALVSPAATDEMTAGATAAHARIDGKQADANALAPEVKNNVENAALKKQVDDLQAELDAMGWQADLDKYGSKEKSVREAIISGEFGDVKDPNDARYEAAIENARKIDEANERIKKNKEAQTEIDKTQENLAEQRAEMEERIKTAREQTKDPNYQGMSSDMQKLAKAEKEYLAAIETRYGKGSEEYKAAAADMASQRSLLMQAEGSEAMRDLTKEADTSAKAAMTDRQRRVADYEERVRELEALKNMAIRNGMSVAEAEKQFNRAVAAERKMLLQDQNSALHQSLEQMGKLAENINASTASWAQSLSDNIYDVVSGKTNSFSAVGDAIRESITRSLTDKASQMLMAPFESLIGGDGTAGSGIGGMIEKALGLDGEGLMAGLQGMLKNVFSGIGSFLSNMFSKSGMVPVKHTGGIVGAGGGWGRSAPMASFIGAPKFHTGGIVGGGKLNLRKGLNPSEVPIIAKKHEGVFTPEQMSYLGGTLNSQSVTINSPITVNGNGGSPEQNNDLAKQMARESEAMMRGLVQTEMARQMRPGGMLRG